MSGAPSTVATSDESTATGTSIRRHALAAALLSLLAPGLGQVYTARLRWIGYFAAAWAVLIALFHTELPSSFLGFAVLLGSFPAIQLVSVVHAGVSAWRNPTIRRERYHRWYVYAGYATAFIASLTAVNAGALASIGQPSIGGPYKPFRAASPAMAPGLRPGEYFVVKLANGASRAELAGDLGKIVVVSWPEAPDLFVYRLAAVGGQTIATRGKDVVIDSKALPRTDLCSFAPELGDPDITRAVETQGGRSYVVEYLSGGLRDIEEFAVPEGYLFVLGDSRDNANDSRFRSATAAQNLAGRALFILWSDDWSRIGRSLAGEEAVARAEYCPAEAK